MVTSMVGLCLGLNFKWRYLIKTIPTLFAARGISPFGTFWKHPEAHSGYSQASKLDLSDKIAELNQIANHFCRKFYRRCLKDPE